MDIQGSVTMDLTEFGVEGTILFAPPSLRRQNELANVLGKVRIGEEDNPMTEIGLGDLTVIQVLYFVKAAPFSVGLRNLEPFFDFCDKVDEIRPGASGDLWDKMKECADIVSTNSAHPFAVSGQSPTTTMD